MAIKTLILRPVGSYAAYSDAETRSTVYPSLTYDAYEFDRFHNYINEEIPDDDATYIEINSIGNDSTSLSLAPFGLHYFAFDFSKLRPIRKSVISVKIHYRAKGLELVNADGIVPVLI